MAWLSVDLLKGFLPLKCRQHQDGIMDTDEHQARVGAAGETQTTRPTQTLPPHCPPPPTVWCHTHTVRRYRINGLTGHLGPCLAFSVAVQAASVQQKLYFFFQVLFFCSDKSCTCFYGSQQKRHQNAVCHFHSRSDRSATAVPTDAWGYERKRSTIYALKGEKTVNLDCYWTIFLPYKTPLLCTSRLF